MMPKREQVTGDPKRVKQTCTELVPPGGPGNGFGTRRQTHPREAKSGGQNSGCGFWTRKTTHPRGCKIRLRILDSENQSPTVCKIRGAKSGPRILDSENHSPTRAKIQGSKIRAADWDIGKPLTHGRQKSGRQNPSYGFSTDFGTQKTSHPPQKRTLKRGRCSGKNDNPDAELSNYFSGGGKFNKTSRVGLRLTVIGTCGVIICTKGSPR